MVNPVPELPVPASVFDANASPLPPLIINLGLPWMKEDTNSAGPGKDHGFGAGRNGAMGDDEGPGGGQGDSYQGAYGNGVTLPLCAYCPEPQYTDQAREAELQGRVTLRVLVGTDGRAWQVQIVQGVGLGSTNAPENPYAPGNLFPRTTPPAAPSHHGSPSKLSSASSSHACVAASLSGLFPGYSRHVPTGGVAFFQCPTNSPNTNLNSSPKLRPAHSGGPPSKLTGIGVLVPPVPPGRPPGPIPAAPASLFLRILGGLLLLGLASAVLFLLFARR